MRLIRNGMVLAGAACALIAVSGCASIEDVERAQATADRALSTAQQAQQTAQAASDRAIAAANRAQQSADAAQSAADRALASTNQSRTDITALNQRFETMQPRTGMRD